MFQERLKGILWVFQTFFRMLGSFKEDWRVFQWSFKWVFRVLKSVFQENFIKVSRVFQESINEVCFAISL